MISVRRLIYWAAALAWCAAWAAAPAAAAPPAIDPAALPALVDRLTWGFTPAEFERARKLGTQGYIDAQLSAPATPQLPRAIQGHIDRLTISQQSASAAFAKISEYRQLLRDMPDGPEKTAMRRRIQAIASTRAADTARRTTWRALYSSNQLHEQMTWFWMNHFNMYAPKGHVGVALADYEDRAVRPHALGRFHDLLAATVRSPSMLLYLDNHYNRAGRINENYARELMELHTLGVDGGYSQKDVQELARILTGLGVNYRSTPPKVPAELRSQVVQEGNFLFNPRFHDYGDKLFLQRKIAGTGLAEVDEAIDILARHPATARHISRKLAQFFVADRPPDDLVAAMAKTFQSSDGDIAATLRTLFASQPFIASLDAGKFKDPMHYVYSSLRLAYAEFPPVARVDTANQWLNRLGQPLYRRITPDGYPLTQSEWSGSGQLTSRFDWARRVIVAPRRFYQAADQKPPVQLPPVPNLPDIYKRTQRYEALSPATRQAIESARTIQDANTYLLASPEFMRR